MHVLVPDKGHGEGEEKINMLKTKTLKWDGENHSQYIVGSNGSARANRFYLSPERADLSRALILLCGNEELTICQGLGAKRCSNFEVALSL